MKVSLQGITMNISGSIAYIGAKDSNAGYNSKQETRPAFKNQGG
jgi:hypothetical protein